MHKWPNSENEDLWSTMKIDTPYGVVRVAVPVL